jgi:hypothetical protein
MTRNEAKQAIHNGTSSAMECRKGSGAGMTTSEEYIAELEAKVNATLELLSEDGWIDGEHHKTWVIDQVARILLGNEYDEWVKKIGDWETGIAP